MEPFQNGLIYTLFVQEPSIITIIPESQDMVACNKQLVQQFVDNF